jgi:hypothetical protein
MQQKPPFPEYFRAVSRGATWELWCKKCDEGYSIPKRDPRPGSLLFLLNHARSHDPSAR